MGGEVPFEYLVHRAAKYCNTTPWEMRERPIADLYWALGLENTEVKAENARREAEAQKAKMRGS